MGMPVTTPTRKLMALPSSRFVVALVLAANGERLEYHDQQGQAHRQLGKEIVIGDRKCEVQAVQ